MRSEWYVEREDRLSMSQYRGQGTPSCRALKGAFTDLYRQDRQHSTSY